MTRILITFFISLFFISVFAQSGSGSLQGKVIDRKTSETLIGATIVLKGTSYGTACDVEGQFIISRVPAGIYTVIISLIGYQQKEILNVSIEAGKSTQLYTSLAEESTNLNEVVVRAEKNTDTEISVISEIRLSQSVAVGVSGEQIAKTQDNDGAQVLKRLPGISIFDDRFIIIRGLSERYNSVLLNGALAPSTEVDNKAFSFDVLPSSVIDRMIVTKSGSYDLPGEFAGGIIRIFTKNTPIENFTNVSLTCAYRNGTTGHTMNHYEGGKTDWLGLDDGTRRLPASFPNTSQMQIDNSNEALINQENATRQLSSTWLPEKFNPLPDYKLSLGLGRRWSLGNTILSNLTSISYNNSHQLMENLQRERYGKYDAKLGSSPTIYNFNDNTSNDQVRIGILHNWALRFNNKHRIEFRNFFNQLGSSQTVVRTGSDAGQSLNVKNYSLYYETRRIYSGQLAGFHQLHNGTWLVDWLLGYTNTNREEPDFRRYVTSFSSDSKYYTVPKPSGKLSLDQNARFFSKLNENSFTAAANLERKIKFGKEGTLDDISIKAGFYTESKQRDFDARLFVFLPTSQFDPNKYPQLKNPVPEILFTTSSIGVDKYLLQEGTKNSDKYTASSKLIAAYLGGSIPFGKWNLSAGLRAEHNVQQVESAVSNRKVSVNNAVLSILPSINLSYNLTDRSLVRVAYSNSVNRPEFREYTPFQYYDFNNRVNIQGNDSLRIPRIYNVDVRWEFYPSPEELISFGAFYKHFIDPIELKISGVANSSANWQPKNADFANSYGLELEMRKSLSSLSLNPIIQKVSTVINASYIYNRVNLGDFVKEQEKNRPMMNQSPYLINTGFFYNKPETGWQASLLYNIFGARLFYAGDPVNYPNAYELPRNQLDFSITKAFKNHLEIRIGVQDVLNSPYRFYQDSNRDGKIKVNNPDEPIILYKKGQYISLGIKYNL